MERIEKYIDKLGRTITVTHDSYNVRIKIDDKKVEECGDYRLIKIEGK